MRLKSVIILMLFLSLFSTGYGQDRSIVLKKINQRTGLKSSSLIADKKLKFTLSDPWLGRDKVHHFLTSAFLSSAGYYFFHEEQNFSNRFSQGGGFGFSLSLGLVKEIRDGFKPDNAFSLKDLVADILGTTVGILLISEL